MSCQADIEDIMKNTKHSVITVTWFPSVELVTEAIKIALQILWARQSLDYYNDSVAIRHCMLMEFFDRRTAWIWTTHNITQVSYITINTHALAYSRVCATVNKRLILSNSHLCVSTYMQPIQQWNISHFKPQDNNTRNM